MKNEMKNEQAVSPVIATILMVAITVVLAGVLYVWANSLASDQPESGTRNSYTADDANAAISATDTDTLIQIRWQHAEDDLNWAFVIIKLTVGDNTHDCGIDGTDNCAIAQDGDDAGLWQVGEFLTLSENSADICGGAGEVTCSVNIHVTYRGTVVAGTSDINLS
jgi:flagellin-like protein